MAQCKVCRDRKNELCRHGRYASFMNNKKNKFEIRKLNNVPNFCISDQKCFVVEISNFSYSPEKKNPQKHLYF